MAEVFVQTNSSDSSSSYITSRRETFTLRMKSLLFHRKGCTVFDSEGRRENSSFGIQGNDDHGNKVEQRTPCFQVRKNRKVLRGGSVDYVVSRPGIELGDETTTTPTTTCYRIQGSSGKLGFRMTDGDGILLVEVEQKRSLSKGVVFGKDVLTLVVEPPVDHSFDDGFCVSL